MAKTITVEINEDAGISVDLNGFNGQGCAAVMKMFDGIGTKTKDIKKPEYKAITCNVVRK